MVQQLTQLYGVSPTPVRESFVELASLGILELLPNRGAVVLPFGLDEVRGIVQIRRVLEVEAALARRPDRGRNARRLSSRSWRALGERLATPDAGGSWVHERGPPTRGSMA